MTSGLKIKLVAILETKRKELLQQLLHELNHEFRWTAQIGFLRVIKRDTKIQTLFSNSKMLKLLIIFFVIKSYGFKIVSK